MGLFGLANDRCGLGDLLVDPSVGGLESVLEGAGRSPAEFLADEVVV
jgi:hypothetical protein